MIQWIEYLDDQLILLVPSVLRRMRDRLYFAGRLRRLERSTKIAVAIELDVGKEGVIALKNAILQQKKIETWMGNCWKYHHRGVSQIRADGFELKVTQTDSAGKEGHAFQIIFPIAQRWLSVDIINPGGGICWKEFDQICNTISSSIELT